MQNWQIKDHVTDVICTLHDVVPQRRIQDDPLKLHVTKPDCEPNNEENTNTDVIMNYKWNNFAHIWDVLQILQCMLFAKRIFSI